MPAGYSTTLLCTQCLVPFERFASNIKAGQHPFCSKTCHDTFQHVQGLFHRLMVRCGECKNLFAIVPSDVHVSGLYFCNADCRQAYYTDISARFWEKVERRDPWICWPWLGAIDPHFGYGAFPYGKAARLVLPFQTKSKQISAHRVAFFLHHGRINLALQTCHSCDYPACCNYDHLFEGTQAQNMQDMFRKGRDRWSQRRKVC